MLEACSATFPESSSCEAVPHGVSWGLGFSGGLKAILVGRSSGCWWQFESTGITQRGTPSKKP